MPIPEPTAGDPEVATEFVTLAVQQSGAARTEMFQGREHRVIPAVIVQEQVLHNNLGRTYLPAADVTQEWAETFDLAPVLTDHPSRLNQPIPARNAGVLNSMGVGFMLGTRAEGGKVKTEVYLDPSRAQAVADLKVILERVDAGKTVELSTGFPLRAMERTPGAFNGREYDVVIHPAAADHLAVFAEKVGACSVRDGCGLGVNHAGDCEPVADPEPVEPPMTTLQKIAALARKAMGGDAVAAPAEAEPTPESTEPVADDDGPSTPEEGSTMNRDQMIAHLAEAGPLDKEALNKLSDCQLTALSSAGKAPATPEEGDSLAWQKAKEYRRRLEELEASTQNARNAEASERTDLLDDLIYNAQSLPWSEAEIKAMDIVELRKVHKLAFPRRADYSGMGGPRGVNAQVGPSIDWVKPIMGGRGDSSALKPKEA